jgi:hypothetical protein
VLVVAEVTVFVDDAVVGRLPRVCVVDGIETEDSLSVRVAIGDGARLGVGWLLVLAGPIGWIFLAVLVSSRSGRPETLSVQLPYSESVHRRVLAARRRGNVGFGAMVAACALGLLVASLQSSTTMGFLTAIVAGIAVAVFVWGLVTAISSNIAVGRDSIDIDLDASRRWVTLRRVHPRFAALASDRRDAHLDST